MERNPEGEVAEKFTQKDIDEMYSFTSLRGNESFYE